MEVVRREAEGLTWEQVVERWEIFHRKYPSSKYSPGTLMDYVATVRNWTDAWLNRPVQSLKIGDAYIIIEEAKRSGASTQNVYRIKTVVNVIFKWGLAHGHVPASAISPFTGIELKKRDSETEPEILKRDEVATMLERADVTGHPWAAIWKVDAYTGLRNSEIEGLRKPDIELVSKERARELDLSSDANKSYGQIRVQRQWKKDERLYGPLKGKYWRTVSDLQPSLLVLGGLLGAK